MEKIFISDTRIFILLIKNSSFTNRELNIDGNSTKGYLFLGVRYKIDAN